jgi:hypothetical protein
LGRKAAPALALRVNALRLSVKQGHLLESGVPLGQNRTDHRARCHFTPGASMSAYEKFCTLRDQRRHGEEAPEHTEKRAFELATMPRALNGPIPDQVGDIFNLIRHWASLPDGQRHDATCGIIGRLNRSYLAGFRDAQSIFQKSVAITLDGHQLRTALDLINPDGPNDRDQLEDHLTFGVRQHQDDDGKVSTGMCCWNDDTDGVLTLDGEYETPVIVLPTTDKLSDEQIVRVWQSMPGGPDGWLKSFGFLQFARAVLAAKNGGAL